MIEEINAAFRGKKFAESSLDENGNLVLAFQPETGGANQENPTITVENVEEGDISFDVPE